MAEDPYEVKGSVVRAHVAYLTKKNKLEAVLRRVGPQSAALLEAPPLASTWVPGLRLVDVVSALHQMGGDACVLEMSRDIIGEQAIQSLIPMVQGVLRIFGASPATLYKRFADLTRTSLRGVDYAYSAISERSGVMNHEIRTPASVPPAAFLPTIPGFELVLSLCGVRGSVSPPEVLGRNRARFRIEW